MNVLRSQQIEMRRPFNAFVQVRAWSPRTRAHSRKNDHAVPPAVDEPSLDTGRRRRCGLRNKGQSHPCAGMTAQLTPWQVWICVALAATFYLPLSSLLACPDGYFHLHSSWWLVGGDSVAGPLQGRQCHGRQS